MLTNLKELGIGYDSNIIGNGLAPLVNLKKLSIQYPSTEDPTSKTEVLVKNLWKYIQCGHFKELNIWKEETSPYVQQIKMDIIEGLFSLIDKDEIKRNQLDYESLKEWYELYVLVPNNFSLGYGDEDTKFKRRSTYTIYPIVYPDEALVYYARLKDIKNGLLSEELVEESLSDLHEELVKTIDNLLNIAEKDLKIYWKD